MGKNKPHTVTLVKGDLRANVDARDVTAYEAGGWVSADPSATAAAPAAPPAPEPVLFEGAEKVDVAPAAEPRRPGRPRKVK